ncbi:MAG: hypothetical protein AB7P08_19050 [Burkholderiales bacterium]
MRTPLIHGAVQAAALALAVVGLYLLAGLAWALCVAGFCTFLASVLSELGSDLGRPAAGRGGE